ncbi:hypothetical protein [Nafulsella turpanensis]|uniref:hypothetical protein n=1 Tax=Nafulsella turpanensis TaxID=1265690 RepID=UPI00034AF927|nr:hypothetical protein [Nafulsella turpanensis]
MKTNLSVIAGLVLFFMSFGAIGVLAQGGKPNYWNILSEVTYKVEEDEYGELYVPEFSEKIKALEGKEVTLQGFIIPFEGMFKPEHLILSSLPIDACFFCGGGGPETVAEVFLEEEIEFTARPVKIKGKFKINKDNLGELMYVLEEAAFVSYADE